METKTSPDGANPDAQSQPKPPADLLTGEQPRAEPGANPAPEPEDSSKPKPKPKPAGRRAKGKAQGDQVDPPVHVVLKTSRFLGADGRSIARGRVVVCPASRASDLQAEGLARPATPEEVERAPGGVAELA